MKRSGRLILFVFSVLSVVSSCVKEENFPVEPQIEFINFILAFDTGEYAKQGILNISFTDGDGDIGLNQNYTFPPFDTGSPYYYNYIITYYEKQQGVFVPLELNPPFSYRIPVLNIEFPGKPIKGMISDTLAMNPFPLYDTIMLEAYIYDRALHKSNVISTPEIILKRP